MLEVSLVIMWKILRMWTFPIIDKRRLSPIQTTFVIFVIFDHFRQLFSLKKWSFFEFHNLSLSRYFEISDDEKVSEIL